MPEENFPFPLASATWCKWKAFTGEGKQVFSQRVGGTRPSKCGRTFGTQESVRYEGEVPLG